MARHLAYQHQCECGVNQDEAIGFMLSALGALISTTTTTDLNHIISYFPGGVLGTNYN